MSKPQISIYPLIILSLAMLLWSSSFIALKFAFERYDPMFVIWGRMIVASCCFVFFIKQFFRFDYKAGDWKLLLLMALLEPCIYFVLEAEALVNTTAAQAGTITAILPLLIALIAYFALGERVSRQQLVGFGIAFTGVIGLSLASEASASAPNPLWGNFLEFLAMCCAAAYSVLLKRFSVRYSAVFLTAFPAFVGGVFFTPFQLLSPFSSHFDPLAAGSIIYLGAVVTLGAYFCYNYAVSKIPVTVAGSFSNLIPVFTIALAWLLLNESFTSSQLVACGVVALGVYISQRR